MNRCIKCGRNIKNAETTSGIEFCKYCGKYEQQLAEKDKEIAQLKESLKQALGFLQYNATHMSMFKNWADRYKGDKDERTD